MNKVFLIGRLTKAPEAKQTPNGVAVTTFTLAVSRAHSKDQTDFLNIVTWRGLAEICGKFIEKGQKIAVCGEIQSRSYEDKNGGKRYITEIVADEVEFLGKSEKKQETEQGFVEKEEI